MRMLLLDSYKRGFGCWNGVWAARMLSQFIDGNEQKVFLMCFCSDFKPFFWGYLLALRVIFIGNWIESFSPVSIFACSRWCPQCRASCKDQRVVLTEGLLVFWLWSTIMIIRWSVFLRPKGHRPCMVRRVRSLPVGYHARTEEIISRRSLSA